VSELRLGVLLVSESACGTTAAAAARRKVELLTGIEGVSSRPVRRIVLVGRRRPLPSHRQDCGCTKRFLAECPHAKRIWLC
jgi:hypothetical protein